MNEALRKKYIPMTETIYYTLLSVMTPRHGYAIIQYVSDLTGGRLLLGTGTLYTMVGRLTADGIIETVPDESRKAYRITDIGLELLREETERLELQLADGRAVLEERCALDGKAVQNGGCVLNRTIAPMGAGVMAERQNLENRGGT